MGELAIDEFVAGGGDGEAGDIAAAGGVGSSFVLDSLLSADWFFCVKENIGSIN